MAAILQPLNTRSQPAPAPPVVAVLLGALPTFIVLVGLLVFGSIWLFAHLPSLLFDWSSPRNVVPPFFAMCLSMSTAAQL